MSAGTDEDRAGTAFFEDPASAIELITELLDARDWSSLAAYYDLSGTGIDRGDLASGTFFHEPEAPEGHPAARAWRHPFPPQAIYLGHDVTGDLARVEVELTVDQGEGPLQRGLHTAWFREQEDGWQILPGDPDRLEEGTEDLEERFQDATDARARGDDEVASEILEEVARRGQAAGSPETLTLATEAALHRAILEGPGPAADRWRRRAIGFGAEAGTSKALGLAADAAATLADHLVHQDQTEEATARYREAMHLGQATGEAHGLATAAWAAADLGRLRLSEDQPGPAAEVLTEGLALARDHPKGFEDLESRLLVDLGEARHLQGGIEAAREAWTEAVGRGTPPIGSSGDALRQHGARASLRLGRLAEAHDDLEAARAAYDQAVSLGGFERPHAPWHPGSRAALEASIRLAGLAEGAGDPRGTADHLARAEELLDLARQTLGPTSTQELGRSIEALGGSAEAGWELIEDER